MDIATIIQQFRSALVTSVCSSCQLRVNADDLPNTVTIDHAGEGQRGCRARVVSANSAGSCSSAALAFPRPAFQHWRIRRLKALGFSA